MIIVWIVHEEIESNGQCGDRTHALALQNQHTKPLFQQATLIITQAWLYCSQDTVQHWTYVHAYFLRSTAHRFRENPGHGIMVHKLSKIEGEAQGRGLFMTIIPWLPWFILDLIGCLSHSNM